MGWVQAVSGMELLALGKSRRRVMFDHLLPGAQARPGLCPGRFLERRDF